MKVGKVASFMGKIFVVRPPTTKTTNILPHENYPLYGILVKLCCFSIMMRNHDVVFCNICVRAKLNRI